MKFVKNSRPIGTLISSLVLSFPLFACLQAQAEFSPGAETSPLEKRYIVKFKDSAAMPLSLDARSQMQDSLLRASGAEIKNRIEKMNAVSVKLAEKDLAKLRKNPDVEYVEVDQPRRLLSQSVPWGIGAIGADMLSDADADNMTVCIIDSGYDITTPDLAANKHTGTNDSGTGNWYEPGGSHGSHVAGIIAAVNNSEGVVGVLPNTQVNLHIVKVFNASGWGYSSSLVRAIQTCADNGAKVVNMSLGGSESTTTELRAMRAIADSGVLLVAAAGNDGDNSRSYPASYDSVMSVGALDDNLDPAYFSQFNNQVEIAAPGVAVLSSVATGDGVQSEIASSALSIPADRVVPHDRFILSGFNYVNDVIGGTITGELAACATTAGGFSCGDMTGKVCLVERLDNQASGFYPEFDAVMACLDAGAASVIAYSNAALPGLQNPFLVDDNAEIEVATVSVDRALGLMLLANVGETVTVTTTLGTDYAFYDGTSMATPYVVGAAALVWSQFPECTAPSIRYALGQSALDLGVEGRDDVFGNGMVQVAAARDLLASEGCVLPPSPPVIVRIEPGVPVEGLAAAAGEALHFSVPVPEGSDPFSVRLSGGTGDAELMVLRARLPSLEVNHCLSSVPDSNDEECLFEGGVRRGIWYISVVAKTAFEGVTLSVDLTPPPVPENFFENLHNYWIPDADERGAISPIVSDFSGDAEDITLNLKIRHTYIGDLVVTLISPTGEEVVLREREGGGTNNLITSYDLSFPGVSAEGRWRLMVQDLAGLDTGYIDKWTLEFN